MDPETPKTPQNSPGMVPESRGLVVDGPRPVILAYNRKKKEYKTYIKLIKAGKVAGAVIMARMLGVDRKTIQEWSKTPAAIRAMNDSIDLYVSKIEASKDWKASAYLLDKITGEKDAGQGSGNTQNIQIINKDGEFSISMK